MINESLRFEYSVCPEISKLAWCAVLKDNKPCQVICGENVEIAADAFVEGAWDGNFTDMSFDSSAFFCGSGGKIRGGVSLCNPKSHLRETCIH